MRERNPCDDDQNGGRANGDPDAAVTVDGTEGLVEVALGVLRVEGHVDLPGSLVQRGGQRRGELVHAQASIRFCRVAVARLACFFTEPELTPSQWAIWSSERSR